MNEAEHVHRVRPINVLVALACIVAVFALVMPAIYTSSRHTQGRTSCANNLKNVALGLQNYCDTYGVFPMGAAHAGSRENPRIGPSWWYAISPFMEQVHNPGWISRTQKKGFEPAGIEFTYASMPDTKRDPIQTGLRRHLPDYMRCRSSPLRLFGGQTDYIGMPTYVGIAGGCDVDPDSPDFDACPDKPVTQDVYVNRRKGTGPNDSIVTSSGMLPPAEHVRLAAVSDGASHTMIVGEQSDFLRSVDPNDSTKYMSGPGWNRELGKNPGGWLSGTRVVERVGPAFPSGRPGTWQTELLFNVTTVRYRPGMKHVLSFTRQDSLPGCAEVMGHNNPLQSPHPGVITAAFTDGSVCFISRTADLGVLLRLAIRDDGGEHESDGVWPAE